MNTALPMLRVARQAGLTLIELMVALTIGLFLTLGLVYMMSDTSRSFKIQDDYARMQENAVSSLRYLSESLRHAGFYGMAAGATTTLTQHGTIPAISNDCGNTLTTDVPLFGYDGLTAATAKDTLPCIKEENFQPGPALIVRLGTGLAVPDDLPAATPPAPRGNGRFDDDMLLQPGYTNTLYVQADPNVGYIFRGEDFATLVSSNLVRKYANGNQFPVFPYQMHVYYVRPCSRPASDGLCKSDSDSGRPIPTLVRQELEGTTMVERPLAEGVERISFFYGLDMLPEHSPPLFPDGRRRGDSIAERYVSNPASNEEWASVISVRVTLLVRSPTPIAGYDDSGKSYDLNGDGNPDFNCAASTEPMACAYKRAVFSQVIQVRNLAFRRGA